MTCRLSRCLDALYILTLPPHTSHRTCSLSKENCTLKSFFTASEGVCRGTCRNEARDSCQPFDHEEQLSTPLPLDGTDRTKQTAVGRGVFYFRFLYPRKCRCICLVWIWTQSDILPWASPRCLSPSLGTVSWGAAIPAVRARHPLT